MDAVHNNTSNDIQISQSIHPNCHEPENNLFIEFVIIPLSLRINVYVMRWFNWNTFTTFFSTVIMCHTFENFIRKFSFILYLFNKYKFVAELESLVYLLICTVGI